MGRSTTCPAIAVRTSRTPSWGRSVGLRLLSAEFVLDYLQLRFDSDPDDPEVVASTEERTGVGLRMDLRRGTLRLRPSIEELTGPEIAMLRGFADKKWMCWRPGEDVFEDFT